MCSSDLASENSANGDLKTIMTFDIFFINYFKNNLSINKVIDDYHDHNHNEIENEENNMAIKIIINEQTEKLSKLNLNLEHIKNNNINEQVLEIIIKFIKLYNQKLITNIFHSVNKAELVELYLKLLQLWNDYYCEIRINIAIIIIP